MDFMEHASLKQPESSHVARFILQCHDFWTWAFSFIHTLMFCQTFFFFYIEMSNGLSSSIQRKHFFYYFFSLIVSTSGTEPWTKFYIMWQNFPPSCRIKTTSQSLLEIFSQKFKRLTATTTLRYVEYWKYN